VHREGGSEWVLFNLSAPLVTVPSKILLHDEMLVNCSRCSHQALLDFFRAMLLVIFPGNGITGLLVGTKGLGQKACWLLLLLLLLLYFTLCSTSTNARATGNKARCLF
jgi:uncharacterized membrane protein YqaE (UPF0057 family)